MMKKKLFQILCVLNLFALAYGISKKLDGEKNNDLNVLMGKSMNQHIKSFLKKQNGFLYELKFGGSNGVTKFESSESFLTNSSKCSDDISYILRNIKSPWAMKLIDSFGKPESGMTQGNAIWVGDYNECLKFYSTNPNSSTVGNFRGKYCFMNLKIQQMPTLWSVAICAPDSCSSEQLEEKAPKLLNMAATLLGLRNKFNFSDVTFLCEPTERHLSGAAISVIAILSLFFALTLTGSTITAFKYFKKIIHEYRNTSVIINSGTRSQLIGDQKYITMETDDENTSLLDDLPDFRDKGTMRKLEAFLSCFCIFTNGSKILNTNTTEGELLCIHGIRCLSMCWVILGHTYSIGIPYMKNLLAVPEYIDTFLFEIVLQGLYSVDTFFVLSGFLLTYLIMNQFSKSNGRIPWAYLYIHRYIRLTPIYMILLGFFATVYLYLGSGPYWPIGDINKTCQENWWKNLLYINNFDDKSEQCMGWTWYLASDMQFFIISPLFLISLWRWPNIGYSLIALFILACWLSNFFITYHFELMTDLFIPAQTFVSLHKSMDYFDKLYIKPYNRISSYLIGMITGYFLYKRKENKYPKHDLVFLCLGWTISSSIGLICVFGLYHQDPPLIIRSFYNALNRTAFALSVAWVIYACLIGQGGFVNRILSCKFFIPLSRLTYAAYLIHPIIINGYFRSMKTSMAFNHPTMVNLFFGFLVTTFTLSLPVTLMLESPIVALEKRIREFFGKQEKTQSTYRKVDNLKKYSSD